MSHVQVSEFQSCFEFVEDPRMTRKCAHPLNSILFLVVAAVIVGAEGPSDIQGFGEQKEDWLRKYVDLPNGIPSHDTIGRVLRLLKPNRLSKRLPPG